MHAPTPKPAILIIDDHPLYRAGVAGVLRGVYGESMVIESGTAEVGLSKLGQRPDVALALVDARLPGMDGYAALEALGNQCPWVARILISGVDGVEAVARARKAGAVGFFPKSLGVGDLLQAVRDVLGGGTYFRIPGRDPAAPAVSHGDALSLRQMEVLAYVGRGYSNKRIARELDVSERTVKWHVTEILSRLGVENRTQALVEAARRRLIPSP